MDQEEARGALLEGGLSAEEGLDNGRGLGEIVLRLRDRDLEEARLRVPGLEGEELVGRRHGGVEVLLVTLAARLQVQGVGVLRILGEDRRGLGLRLLEALGLEEHVAELEAGLDVRGLDLEGLPVVQDRLVRLLRPGIDRREVRVGLRRARLELQGVLQGGGRPLGVPRREVLGPELQSRLGVPRIEAHVLLEDPRRLLVVLEPPGVEVRRLEEDHPVLGVDLDEGLEFSHGLLEVARRVLRDLRLAPVELSEDQVRLGVAGAQLHGLLPEDDRLVELVPVPEELRLLDQDGPGPPVEPLGLPVLGKGPVLVPGKARLLPEGEVVVGLGAILGHLWIGHDEGCEKNDHVRNSPPLGIVPRFPIWFQEGIGSVGRAYFVGVRDPRSYRLYAQSLATTQKRAAAAVLAASRPHEGKGGRVGMGRRRRGQAMKGMTFGKRAARFVRSRMVSTRTNRGTLTGQVCAQPARTGIAR